MLSLQLKMLIYLEGLRVGLRVGLTPRLTFIVTISISIPLYNYYSFFWGCGGLFFAPGSTIRQKYH